VLDFLAVNENYVNSDEEEEEYAEEEECKEQIVPQLKVTS
jgi:hypothetical protein